MFKFSIRSTKMKRLITAAVFVACSALAFSEGAGSNVWLWPIVSEWQSYEVGKQTPMEGSKGSADWPTAKTMDDPFRAARDGTLNPTMTVQGTGSQQNSSSKK